jgi:hypothetical protein
MPGYSFGRAIGASANTRRKPRSEMDKMGYLFGQKRQKVGRATAPGRSVLSRHTGAGQHGAWHVVLAACSADRKAAADGMRAIFIHKHRQRLAGRLAWK